MSDFSGSGSGSEVQYSGTTDVMMTMNHTGHNDVTTGMHGGHHHMGATAVSGGHSGHDGMMHPPAAGHRAFYSMEMNFYVLLRDWLVTDTKGLLLACLGSFFLAVFYELLKNGRQMWSKGFFVNNKQSLRPNDMVPSGGDCCNNDEDDFYYVRGTSFWYIHLVQSFLYIIQVFFAFVLMLIVMSYNVYVTIAICVGDGVGYFIAGCIRRWIILRNQVQSDHIYMNDGAGNVITLSGEVYSGHHNTKL